MNSDEIEHIELCRHKLEEALKKLVVGIGDIPIGDGEQHLPFGWRKAAKGRTVWRILEEVISQNLEKCFLKFDLLDFEPASSEVGVYDFRFSTKEEKNIYVNIKSAVKGGRTNKDDISKAEKLKDFFIEFPSSVLLIATIVIEFLENPTAVRLSDCAVVPITWLPDIYVNPSNNGNLQSSKYKELDSAIRRTNSEFVRELTEQMRIARQKKLDKKR
jgi:hypothetical protein